MADRFFTSDLSTATATLSGPEAHHALHVLRLKVGDDIRLFDGAGTTVTGVVESAGRRDVEVTIKTRSFAERRAEGRVIVAAAPPKGDRLKWMVEKLTELGVDEYIPLRTHRSVVDAAKWKPDKLQATIIAAAKQCARDWLMDIAEPIEFAALISDVQPGHSLHIAHPYAVTSQQQSATLGSAHSHMVLIGPEGGFTDDEVELAVSTAAAAPLEWPGTILRVETAAIMAAVMLRNLSVS